MMTWRTLSTWASGLSLVLALSACPDDGTSQPDDTPASELDVPSDVEPDPDGGETSADVDIDTPPTPDDADVGPEADSVDPTAPWQLEPLGDTGHLETIFMVSSDEAYAVGGRRVLRFNGASWATFGEPGAVELHGVWSDGAVVVAVGDGGFIARRLLHELTWTVEDAGVGADLYAIAGRDAADLWAVGDDATVLRDDGDGWSVVTAHGGTDLRAVWVDPTTPGAAGVFAVGTGGQLVLNEGTWYNKQIAKGSAVLRGIWGIDGAIWAVGSEATIAYRAPGESWKGQGSNDDKERDLNALAGRSATDAVAVGEDGVVVRFDGDKWNVEALAGPVHLTDDLVGVGFGAGETPRWLAVGADGGGCRFEGDGWSDMATRPTADVRDLSYAGGRLWGAGTSGLLLAYTEAHGWTALPSGTHADLSAVAIDDDGVLWAAGAEGTLLRRPPDGAVEAVTVPAFVDLLGVAAADEVVVVGKGGTLLRKGAADEGFTLANSGTSADLRTVAWGDDGALWIGGAFGTLLRSVDGAKPAAMASNVGADLHDLTPTAGGVLAVGDNGTVLAASASGTQLLWEEPGLFLYGVSEGASGTFAVGWNGSVLRREGDAFVHEQTQTSAVLEAVYNDDQLVIAAGRQGVLLERKEVP